jgi:hypothetical protein
MKSNYYEAYANYRTGIDFMSKLQIGNTITYLKKTNQLIKKMLSSYPSKKMKKLIDDLSTIETQKYKEADYDNIKVYHEIPPEYSSLDPIAKKRLVKAIPIESFATLLEMNDPFIKLIPIHVLEAVNEYKQTLNVKIIKNLKESRDSRDKIKK